MRRVDLLGWMLGAATIAALAGGACTEPNAKPADVSSSSTSSPAGSSAELAASEPGPYTLSREPLAVTLRVPEARRERLAAAGSPSANLRLVIEGIEILRPGAVYEVHLEPSESGTPGSTAPSFLGHIAIYGKPGETPESSRGFDVTGRARALASRGTAGAVRVLFVPSDGEGASAGAPEAFLRFRRIALVERPPAGR